MQGLSTSTAIEQKQALIINAAQLQKIEILQMNAIELEEKIRDELMENPVLEISEEAHSEERYTERIEDNRSDDDRYDDYDDDWDSPSKSAKKTDYSESSIPGLGVSEFENFYRSEENLTEYLLKQLGTVKCSDEIRRAAGYIVCSLRSDGYLDAELSEIAEMARCTLEEAEEGLSVVHKLDPLGIGARTLEECLCLQLDPSDELTEDAIRVINDHLNEIATGKIKAITDRRKITPERLIRIIERIRTLDPKPGSHFSDNNPVQYMHPDVYATIKDGEMEIWLAGSQPQLCVSTYYSSLIKSSNDAAVTQYLKERIDSASALINNIEQRNSTIIKVSAEILEYQRNFFEFGDMALRPLTMQELADSLEISVSTISRAVSGKNIHCNGKLYPLKKFFVSEIAGMARDTVLERIKELIDQEDKRHPLSDREIAEILSQEGIDISRRTVAKYRDAEGIMSTSMRKIR